MFLAKNVDSFWRFLPGKSGIIKLTFFWASRPGFYQKSRFWPWLNAHKLSCKSARDGIIYIGYPPPPLPNRKSAILGGRGPPPLQTPGLEVGGVGGPLYTPSQRGVAEARIATQCVSGVDPIGQAPNGCAPTDLRGRPAK